MNDFPLAYVEAHAGHGGRFLVAPDKERDNIMPDLLFLDKVAGSRAREYTAHFIGTSPQPGRYAGAQLRVTTSLPPGENRLSASELPEFLVECAPNPYQGTTAVDVTYDLENLRQDVRAVNDDEWDVELSTSQARTPEQLWEALVYPQKAAVLAERLHREIGDIETPDGGFLLLPHMYAGGDRVAMPDDPIEKAHQAVLVEGVLCESPTRWVNRRANSLPRRVLRAFTGQQQSAANYALHPRPDEVPYNPTTGEPKFSRRYGTGKQRVPHFRR